MIRKLIFEISFLILISVHASGQIDSLPTKAPLVSLKLVPSALLNFTIPSFQIGAEYQVYKRFNISHELGLMISEQPYLWRGGFRHMTEGRLYFDPLNTNGSNRYIGMQFRYWWFRAIDEGVFCRQNCLFSQTLQHQIEQRGIGTAITYGNKRYFINDKIFWEFAVSMGRIFRKNATDLPEDVDISGFPLSNFNIFGTADRWRNYKKNVITLHLDLRFGYDIN